MSTTTPTTYSVTDLQAWRDAIDAWLAKSATPAQLATLKHFEGVDIGHVAIAVLEETVARFNHAIWCTLTEYAWEEDESQAFADLALCYLEPVKNPGRTLEECEADVERARATLIECLDRQKERQVDAPPPADPALLAMANRTLGEQLAEAVARAERAEQSGMLATDRFIDELELALFAPYSFDRGSKTPEEFILATISARQLRLEAVERAMYEAYQALSEVNEHHRKVLSVGEINGKFWRFKDACDALLGKAVQA